MQYVSCATGVATASRFSSSVASPVGSFALRDVAWSVSSRSDTRCCFSLKCKRVSSLMTDSADALSGHDTRAATAPRTAQKRQAPPGDQL